MLCLQETKAPVDKLPLDGFGALGYAHVVAAAAQKGYNGVAILSRLPLEDAGAPRLLHPRRRPPRRGAAARRARSIHNLYVPAGGDVPDPALNPKFAHKLDFLAELRAWFAATPARAARSSSATSTSPRARTTSGTTSGSLQVVSHTPVEVEALRRRAGRRRLGRRHPRARPRRAGSIPGGPTAPPDWQAADKGRRLDHIWATPDLAERSGGSRIARHVRGWEQPERPRPGLRRVRGDDRRRASTAPVGAHHPRPPRGAQRPRPGRDRRADRAARRLGRPRRPARRSSSPAAAAASAPAPRSATSPAPTGPTTR